MKKETNEELLKRYAAQIRGSLEVMRENYYELKKLKILTETSMIPLTDPEMIRKFKETLEEINDEN